MDWRHMLRRSLLAGNERSTMQLLFRKFRQHSATPARLLRGQLGEVETDVVEANASFRSAGADVVANPAFEPTAADAGPRKDRLILRYKELTAEYGLENTHGTLRPHPKLRSELTHQNAQEMLMETMIPLHRFSYEKQLTFKRGRARILVRNLTNRLKVRMPELPLTDEGLMCEVASTQPSPETRGFRNKSEFCCGTDIMGAKKTIGYIVGSVSRNDAVVVPPQGLINMPDSHHAIAKAFQDFCRMSPLDACIWGINSAVGYWRGITVRSNRAGDTLAIIGMHPQKLTQAELSQQRHSVKSYFVDGPGASLGIRSLYFQACRYTRCNHYQAPYIHLAGDLFIFEQLGSKRFRISPGSFYQLNPGGAEALYETIRSLLQPDGRGCLLDVCCGTGAIGIYMADSFRRVIGCDVEPLAIDDANHNARILNRLENCEFYEQSAERAVPAWIHGFEYDETDAEKRFSRISAVVNPSRNGLEWSVIKALRECAAIDDVVYVSCRPLGNAMRNIADLTMPTSQNHPGEPFRLTKVVPVDMFPNTEHCELVFLYQRNRPTHNNHLTART